MAEPWTIPRRAPLAAPRLAAAATRGVAAALALLAFAGCHLVEGLSSRAVHPATTGFEVTSFTSQVQFPGVESNLQSTVAYRITLTGDFPEGAQRFELWVDTVAIPVRLIQDRTGVALDMAPGRRLDVRFTANRHHYRQGTSGAMILPEESYRITGTTVPGTAAWLAFSDRWGNLSWWDLGEPEVLPRLYAP